MCALSNDDISMTLTDPYRAYPVFMVTAFLKSNISKKRCVLGTNLLRNTNKEL